MLVRLECLHTQTSLNFARLALDEKPDLVMLFEQQIIQVAFKPEFGLLALPRHRYGLWLARTCLFLDEPFNSVVVDVFYTRKDHRSVGGLLCVHGTWLLTISPLRNRSLTQSFSVLHWMLLKQH
jgi:hypothetical protein